MVEAHLALGALRRAVIRCFNHELETRTSTLTLPATHPVFSVADGARLSDVGCDAVPGDVVARNPPLYADLDRR
jgi:hypothetical protein